MERCLYGLADKLDPSPRLPPAQSVLSGAIRRRRYKLPRLDLKSLPKDEGL